MKFRPLHAVVLRATVATKLGALSAAVTSLWSPVDAVCHNEEGYRSY